MNPFFNMMRPNPMNQLFNVVKQIQQIKRNPNMLANLLQQRGMITPQQAQDIQQMGTNYQQIGQYLINNRCIPDNVEQYQNTVNQVQTMMK